jgi:hypothetical protein
MSERQDWWPEGMKPSGFGGWIPDNVQLSASAISAAKYAEFASGCDYYTYESDLLKAGVEFGVDGIYILSVPVNAIWTDPVGLSKQFGVCPSGKKVSIKWKADMAGKIGYGKNRMRRATMTVI